MVRKVVASARRSQLVSTYGVGALFPAEDQSLMICGLDEWPGDERNAISEPRLAASLGVKTFRAPASGLKRGDIPTVRFPEFHFCVSCRALRARRKFCSDDQSQCQDCGGSISPSRFVACCPRGHIQDFPYWAWVHAGTHADTSKPHELRITTRGVSSSLSDIVISCSCDAQPATMAGTFLPGAMKGVASCRGERPWLVGADAEDCSEPLRVLQRGSSNVWFPVVRSAISIPPWSDEAYHLARRYFKVLRAAERDALPSLVQGIIPGAHAVQVRSVVDAVLDLRGEGPEKAVLDEEELRAEEYGALMSGRAEESPRQQFVCVNRELRRDTAQLSTVAQLAEVSRLREVRALQAFSRLSPWSPGSDSDRRAALSLGQVDWLPAIEVLGEGIFVRLDESRLRNWEDSSFAQGRARLIEDASTVSNGGGSWANHLAITPRSLLLHSFAHILITELSLNAGYPEASLRERLYTAEAQAGVLIYTATADSAGSLGGLSAQSDPATFERVLTSAILRAQWCTNDPVCAEATGTGVGGLNLAACHACMMLPETSCERFNSLLDRGCLIGVPGSEAAGFFHIQ